MRSPWGVSQASTPISMSTNAAPPIGYQVSGTRSQSEPSRTKGADVTPPIPAPLSDFQFIVILNWRNPLARASSVNRWTPSPDSGTSSASKNFAVPGSKSGPISSSIPSPDGVSVTPSDMAVAEAMNGSVTRLTATGSSLAGNTQSPVSPPHSARSPHSSSSS